jgi:predicted ABC-type ATPase
MPSPQAVILAGPNGAGKTTMSAGVVPPEASFLNADIVAAQLRDEGHGPSGIDVAAGRIILTRLHEHVEAEESFCLETNLASRGLLRSIEQWHDRGYVVHLFFTALDSPDLAVQRVAERVARGGHDIPESVIRRRWTVGLSSLFQLYMPTVDGWTLADNSGDRPLLVAEGERGASEERIVNEERWALYRSLARGDDRTS